MGKKLNDPTLHALHYTFSPMETTLLWQWRQLLETNVKNNILPLISFFWEDKKKK